VLIHKSTITTLCKIAPPSRLHSGSIPFSSSKCHTPHHPFSGAGKNKAAFSFFPCASVASFIRVHSVSEFRSFHFVTVTTQPSTSFPLIHSSHLCAHARKSKASFHSVKANPVPLHSFADAYSPPNPLLLHASDRSRSVPPPIIYSIPYQPCTSLSHRHFSQRIALFFPATYLPHAISLILYPTSV